MVVVVQPAVKGGGAFGAGAVERAVGPAAEHGSDEALSLAVGLRAVGAGAQVADAHGATRDRVHRRAVGRAIVGDQALDDDAVAGEKNPPAPPESERGGGPLLVEGPPVRPQRA